MSTNSSLDRSLVQGIAWTGGMKWVTQIVSWGVTIFVARLLTPNDYGLVGMAMIYMGFAQILSDAGLYAAIIQKRALTEAQIASLNGLSIMIGIALCTTTLATAAPLAWFFGEPDVEYIMAAFSITFLTRSAQVVPKALMSRDLQFQRVAWVDALESLTLMAATLLLAVDGFGYWSLVLGALVSSIATTGLCLWWRPHRITLPASIASVADAAEFGWHVLASQVAWYAYSNADFAVVGRVLGKAALGTYSYAWTLASIPVDRVSGLIGRVTPAFFSAVQHDPPSLRRFLCNLTEALALITMPACIGLALVGDDFVRAVLGPNWTATTTPLRLLALYAAFRSIVTPLPQILVATGRSRQSMRFSIFAALVLPVAFYIGSRWGTTGVAMGWIVVYPMIAIGFFLRSALRSIDLKSRDYLRALSPALVATLGMSVALWLVRAGLPGGWAPLTRLLAQVVTGALVYGAIVLTVHGARLRSFRALLRGTKGGWEAECLTHQTADRPERPRLLLISGHFPPDPAVGALRWQKFARHAAERGWGLDVIALHPATLPARDPARLADLPDGVRVYGIPLIPSRVETMVSTLWSAARWPARVLGWSNGVGSHPESVGRTEMRWRPREPRDLLRGYAAWIEYARYGRWARDAARLARRLVDSRHRAVITCGPPHVAHMAGVDAHVECRLPLVVDLRDPWSLVQRLPEGTASPVWLALAERYERRAVAHASLVIANTHALRNAMCGKYPSHTDRIITVLNGYDEDQVPESRPGRRFVLAYAGSIYLDRNPRHLFRAAANLVRDLRLGPDDFGIDLMGSVEHFDGVPLEQIAAEEGVSDHVVLHAPRPRAEALEFLSRASMLVTLPQDSDMAIPAKLYDYMRFDAWLLVLATKDSATALLLRDTGTDIVAPGDLDGLTAVLRQRYVEFRRGGRGRRLAVDSRFSRRAQAETLFKAIEAVAGSAPAVPGAVTGPQPVPVPVEAVSSV